MIVMDSELIAGSREARRREVEDLLIGSIVIEPSRIDEVAAPDESTYSGRFAARLRMLREKAGLTVDQVAQAISADGHTAAARAIYNWEQGKTSPPVNAYPPLSRALGLKSVRALLPEE